jgi:hypothetical protein
MNEVAGLLVGWANQLVLTGVIATDGVGVSGHEPALALI